MSRGIALLPLALALCLAAGCDGFLFGGDDNDYTGGSIPWGKGPVVTAGFVVEATAERTPIRGAVVEVLDSGGRVHRNTTDRRGIFVVDGIRPGLISITATGRGGLLPFSCAIEAPNGARITASLALYGREEAPNASSGAQFGDFAIDLPGQVSTGDDPATPQLPSEFELYAPLVSYICVTEAAACIDPAGSLIPKAAGQARLQAFFEGASSSTVVQIEGEARGEVPSTSAGE